MPIICYGYSYIVIIEEAGYKRKKNISFSFVFCSFLLQMDNNSPNN